MRWGTQKWERTNVSFSFLLGEALTVASSSVPNYLWPEVSLSQVPFRYTRGYTWTGRKSFAAAIRF